MVEEGPYDPDDVDADPDAPRSMDTGSSIPYDTNNGPESPSDADFYSFSKMSSQEKYNTIASNSVLLLAGSAFIRAGTVLISSGDRAELLLAIILFFLGITCIAIVIIFLLAMKMGKDIESSKSVEVLGTIFWNAFLFSPIWLPIILGTIAFFAGYPFGLALIGIGFIMYYELAENLITISRGGRVTEENADEDPKSSGQGELMNDTDVEWEVGDS